MTLDPSEREALRIKYRQERDKRLRPDGNAQYIEPTGRFARLLEDPFTPRVEREPCFDEVTVAFIGAGFSGLCVGARLKQAGIADVRLIDGAGDVGGVWYWNRYPGAMCDTAAMVYLPLLEETGHVPTMKYVFAPEIFAHAQRIATKFRLYEKALFSTAVTGLEWDEASSRWIIQTDRGDRIRARFVGMGTGPLHRPKLPGIPGIETYAGHCFHTSRWDYAYTGGDPSGAPMTKLADKRVGIIGTGATAVQCIPPLGRDAKELFVFQRTPSSIDVRNNHPIDPEWFNTLEPGWQQRWLTNFATLQTGGFADEDLVKDGWTDIAIRVRDRVVKDLGMPGSILDMALIQKAFEDSDDEKMTEIRARVDALVKDPKTAAALKPWYRQLCKRPCFHDEYLQTFNRPNVHLIDTDGKGVERIDATGVWVAGVHYEVDCLIFASGFEFATDYARRAGFDPIGRGGRRLSAHWADGMRTLHGMHVHGFPNLFVVGLGQNGNLISNITQNLDDIGKTMAAILRHAQDIGATEVEVTEAAENDWVTLIESSPQGFLGNPECTPGYYNNEGGPIGRRERLNVSGYPMGPVAYFEYIDRWRRSGKFEGLSFRSASPSAAVAS
ncbi:MAG TPA: NAD(P)/FAD-dependent oxidoreductase [Candidatus Limnocylindria bacterium]|nr:NAD(P)/FAD-dependent oxidoreductase [Candidatus Limnocylindria bacterium]